MTANSSIEPERPRHIRKPISTRLRFDIFKRDGFTCQYCGAHPPKVILHVDHITPVAKGGQNDQDNLVTACSQCNLGKAANSLHAIPQSLADKAAEVAEREAQLKGYADVLNAKKDRIEDEAWEIADELDERYRKNGIQKDWFLSIKRFIERLGFHPVLDAMEIAVSRKRGTRTAFKYFCGICWNRIREADNGES